MSIEMRNMLVVVSVLLVTIAYQAVLSPPGGFWQANSIPGTNTTAATSATNEVNQVPHWAGTVTFSIQYFYLLATVNIINFYIPLFLIVLYLPPAFPSPLLTISAALLGLSYGTSIIVTAPNPSNWLPYFLLLTFILLFNIAVFLLFAWKTGIVYKEFLDPEKMF
jgi:hypothetical protein